MKKILGIVSVLLLMVFGANVNAQTILKGGSKEKEVTQTLEEGATVLDSSLGYIKAVNLEQGDILVLFERYTNEKISGRYRLITANEPNLSIGFKCMYAIIFKNVNDEVIGFEESNFSGKSIIFQKGKTAMPEDFGLSSIYIPQGSKIKLYMTDPALYPDQEIDHRPMGPGIRPFVGVDINDKVKFIVVQ
jgi:hypothetical protein